MTAYAELHCHSTFSLLDGASDPERLVERAVALAPTSLEARNSLGLALTQQGDAERAIATFQAITRDDPSNATARLNLGMAFMQRGDLNEAIAVFRELVRLQPASAEGHYNLGLALKQQDEFAAAEESLKTAAALDTTLPEPPFTLGVVLWQTGRTDEAVAAFGEAIARRSDSR